MRFGSVCSGIEAASVAFGPLGWEAAWLAEIEAFPSAVLAHHYPTVPNLGDMTKIAAMVSAEEIEAPDLLCGGTPCQSFSVAGLRKSLDDARGNLSLEFIRIANAIDDIRRNHGRKPAYILWENVPGVLSTKDNAFGAFLGGLCGRDAAIPQPGGGWTSAGVVAGPQRVVAWRVLDAQYFGLAQRRRRVFVLALGGAGGWACADALLSITNSLSGHPAPRRQAGKVAPTIPSRSTAGGGLGTDFDCDGGLQVAGTMKACKDSGGWSNSADHAAAGYMIPVETLCVATGQAGAEIGAEIGAEMAPTLNCNHEAPYVVGALACNTGPNGHDAGNFACNQAVDAGHIIAHSLRGEGFDASEDGTGRGTPLVPVACEVADSQTVGANQTFGFAGEAIAIQGTLLNRSDTAGPAGSGISAGGVSFTQTKTDVHAVQYGMQVRRLTPEECEALQGFPRGYTNVPHRKKPAADGPRYKALGNSWAVPNVRWIGERIDAVQAIKDARKKAA